jgi:hypothetical protein
MKTESVKRALDSSVEHPEIVQSGHQIGTSTGTAITDGSKATLGTAISGTPLWPAFARQRKLTPAFGTGRADRDVGGLYIGGSQTGVPHGLLGHCVGRSDPLHTRHPTRPNRSGLPETAPMLADLRPNSLVTHCLVAP